MPNLDGKGPAGKGPKTGNQLGDCEGAASNCPAQGAGMGMGNGNGRGRSMGMRRGCCPFFDGATKEQQVSVLEDEIKALKEEIEDIKKKITTKKRS